MEPLNTGGGGGGGIDRGGMNSSSNSDGWMLMQDLRHPGLNAIRFASYRTAAKLRYVQKKTNSKLIFKFFF